MRHLTTILSLAVVTAFGVSCQTPGSRLHAQWPQTVERARVRVLDQLPDLDAASREMIRTCDPRVEYVGAPFGGDYTFVWQITSNRMATLNAFSTPESVDDKPVRIREPVRSSRH